jgi:hypothetical protein
MKIYAEGIKDDVFNIHAFREIYQKGSYESKRVFQTWLDKAKAQNDEELVNFYEGSDEEYYLSDKIFNNLSIIALYMDIEYTFKYILKNIFQIDAKKLKIEEIKKQFKNIQIDIEKNEVLYDKIDTLRLLNNGIKHNGCVSSGLSNKSSDFGELDKEIKVTNMQVDSFIEDMQQYKSFLYQQVTTRIREPNALNSAPGTLSNNVKKEHK